MAPRSRVIIDNDFAGDPDDLFQLAHHVLSPSVEIPFVIASKLPSGMGPGSDGSVARGVDVALRLLDLLGSTAPVFGGSDAGLEAGVVVPDLSPAASRIIEEAMRTDSDVPLFLAMGGGLTELASALLHEPGIVDRMTLVWIGGDGASDGQGVAPTGMPEYNTMIDPIAAQVVFASSIPIWQVPREAYTQCIVSWAELDAKVRPLGEFGRHLVDRLHDFIGLLEGRFGMNLGETFILGDNPLVLLTALGSSFGADPASSSSELRPRRDVTPGGAPDGAPLDLPPVRVFTRIDTRLMFEDMFAKFAQFSLAT